MPTYQYSCTQCGHFFEQVQSFSDDALTECPVCAGRLRKVFNAVGVVFKGSGFYRNDSRSEKGSENGSGSGSGSKTEKSEKSEKSGTTVTSEGSGTGGGSGTDSKPAPPKDTPAKKGDASPASGSSSAG